MLSGDVPSCVNGILEFCHSSGFTDSGRLGKWEIDPRYYTLKGLDFARAFFADDCVARYFLGHGLREDSWMKDYEEHGYDPFKYMNCAFTASGCNVPQEELDAYIELFEYLHTGTTYVNDACELVEYPGYICGTLDVYYVISPISLLWEEGSNINARIELTQFPLDSEKTGQWYTWHATKSTPLLVYDPGHTGVVSGAHQLFGNFTFGKKWNNGYEALRTLDKSGDGKLTGNELKDLALWFDHNSNGVSEKGEVRDAVKAGLKSLSVQAEAVDSSTGDIYVARGFERDNGGSRIVGASVDWFAKGADSKMAAIAELNKRTAQVARSTTSSESSFEALQLGEVAGSFAHNLSGGWEWSVEENGGIPGDRTPRGFFTLKDFGKAIVGHSYLEGPVKENEEGIKRSISIFELTGRKHLNTDGQIVFNFAIQAKGGTLNESEAVLSADGQTLSGKTTAQVLRGAKARQAAPLEYTWSAKKVVPAQ